jgi:hypothetical protein
LRKAETRIIILGDGQLDRQELRNALPEASAPPRKAKKFFAAGGRRNLLKRLISDERIQENPNHFFGFSWLWLSRGFAGFGEIWRKIWLGGI